jgi:threonine dehydratase
MLRMAMLIRNSSYSVQKKKIDFSAATCEDLVNVTKNDILSSSEAVRARLPTTPVTQVEYGVNSVFYLKNEVVTPSQSFKFRAAANVINDLHLRPEKKIGVYTASTGNFALSLAIVLRSGGINLTAVTPLALNHDKEIRLQSLGCRIIKSGLNLEDSVDRAQRESEITGGIFISPICRQNILGYASLGLEIFSEVKKVDYIFFPMGIGGGITGITVAKKLFSPGTKIIGVVPENSDCWFQSVNAKLITGNSQSSASASDGLRTSLPDIELFKYLRDRLHGVITVGEGEVLAAQKYCEATSQIRAEPTGVVGLAGAKKYLGAMETDRLSIVIPICGGYS